MEHKLKQRGYLLIISALAIVIAALVGVLIIGMFTGGIKSTTGVSQSNSALCLAHSGLQLVKHDILVQKNGCYVANLYQNKTIPNMAGQYTVTGCFSKTKAKLAIAIDNTYTGPIYVNNLSTYATSLLAQNISDTSNSIVVNDAGGFLDSGTIKIGQEYIGYKSKTGNTLDDVVRGAIGTIPTAHSLGDTVTQGLFLPNGFVLIDDEIIEYKQVDLATQTLSGITRGAAGTPITGHAQDAEVTQTECVLTATASLPDLLITEGKRIVKEIILAISNPSFISGEHKSAVVSSSDVALIGNTLISNPYVSQNDPDFSGSTVLAGGNATINGAAETQYADGGSNQGNLTGDVEGNNPDAQDLFYNIFGVNINAIKDTINPNNVINPSDFATRVATSDNQSLLINGNISFPPADANIGTEANPKIPNLLFFNGNLHISDNKSNIYLGTTDKPVIILVDGEFSVTAGSKANIVINGMIFTTQGIDISGSIENLSINGFIASEGDIKLTGTTSITFNPEIISIIKNSEIVTEYLTSSFGTREIFR